MVFSNHHPHSSLQQVLVRQWCCTAHCEEHDQLLRAYEAIDSKLVALRNKAIQTTEDASQCTENILLQSINVHLMREHLFMYSRIYGPSEDRFAPDSAEWRISSS
ncbi:hypothetical protein QCA50_019565 [Cerrena zonata]|uniref:Uncharacterized protein n=1 Tax=Cerrena zonata TaxID=2478898 RepID=A0AAW0FC02_9APHY